MSHGGPQTLGPKQVQSGEANWDHAIPAAAIIVGITAIAGTILLGLAVYQIFPSGVNVISELGEWGNAAVCGTGAFGVGTIAAASVKIHENNRASALKEAAGKQVPVVIVDQQAIQKAVTESTQELQGKLILATEQAKTLNTTIGNLQEQLRVLNENKEQLTKEEVTKQTKDLHTQLQKAITDNFNLTTQNETLNTDFQKLRQIYQELKTKIEKPIEESADKLSLEQIKQLVVQCEEANLTLTKQSEELKLVIGSNQQLTEQVKVVQKEKGELEIRFKELTTQFDETKLKIEEHNQTIESLKNQHTLDGEEAKKLTNQIETLTNEKTEFTKLQNERTLEMEKVKKEFGELTNKVTVSTQEKENLQKQHTLENENTEKLFKILKDEKAKLIEDQKGLNEQAEIIKQKLEQDVRDIKLEKGKLNQLMTELRKEIVDLKNKLTVVMKEKENLQKQFETHQKSSKEDNEKSSPVVVKNTELNEEIETLENAKTGLEQKQEELNIQIIQYQQNLNTKQIELEEKEKTLKEVQLKNTSLGEEKQTTTKILRELEEEKVKLQSQLKESQEKLQTEENSVINLQKALQGETAYKNRIENLEKEIELLKNAETSDEKGSKKVLGLTVNKMGELMEQIKTRHTTAEDLNTSPKIETEKVKISDNQKIVIIQEQSSSVSESKESTESKEMGEKLDQIEKEVTIPLVLNTSPKIETETADNQKIVIIQNQSGSLSGSNSTDSSDKELKKEGTTLGGSTSQTKSAPEIKVAVNTNAVNVPKANTVSSLSSSHSIKKVEEKKGIFDELGDIFFSPNKKKDGDKT